MSKNFNVRIRARATMTQIDGSRIIIAGKSDADIGKVFAQLGGQTGYDPQMNIEVEVRSSDGTGIKTEGELI